MIAKTNNLITLEKYTTELNNLSEKYFEFEDKIIELVNTLNELKEKEKQFYIENKEPITIEKSFEFKSIQIAKFEISGKKDDLYLQKTVFEQAISEALPENIAVQFKLISWEEYSIKKILSNSNNGWELKIENLNRMGLNA